MKSSIGKRSIVVALMLIAVLMIAALSVDACTSVYVGSKVSADGTIIFSRSNDHQSVWPNYIKVVEGSDEADSTMTNSES